VAAAIPGSTAAETAPTQALGSPAEGQGPKIGSRFTAPRSASPVGRHGCGRRFTERLAVGEHQRNLDLHPAWIIRGLRRSSTWASPSAPLRSSTSSSSARSVAFGPAFAHNNHPENQHDYPASM
jgi:hypothetical protein